MPRSRITRPGSPNIQVSCICHAMDGSYPGDLHMFYSFDRLPLGPGSWPTARNRCCGHTLTLFGSIVQPPTELASTQPQRPAPSASRRKPVKCRFFATRKGRSFRLYCSSCTLLFRNCSSIQVITCVGISHTWFVCYSLYCFIFCCRIFYVAFRASRVIVLFCFICWPC